MMRTSPNNNNNNRPSASTAVVPLSLLLLLLLLLLAITDYCKPAAAFQLTICQNEDFVKCTNYTRPGPGSSGTCTPAPWNDNDNDDDDDEDDDDDDDDDYMSSFVISCGCCEFFSDSGCRGRLFTACNEEKSTLSGGGGGGEGISSFRCYY